MARTWRAPQHREPKHNEAPGQSLASGLYIVATPIGNARDVTLRALDVLEAVDLIAAEDTRVTAKLLTVFGISRSLTAYNDHNGARERPRLIGRLKEGARIALVSDAGTPLVSDPGYKLVREALAEGIAVQALPGASAPLVALALAGLPSDRFLFAGFLPSRSAERRTALAQLNRVRSSLIFFEAPQRLAETLADLCAVLGNRPAAVARELTKLHEEVRRNDLAALAAYYAEFGQPKGEITIVIGPPEEEAPDMERVGAALDRVLEYMPVRAAVDLVAEMLRAPRRDVYALALKKKGDDSEQA